MTEPGEEALYAPASLVIGVVHRRDPDKPPKTSTFPDGTWTPAAHDGVTVCGQEMRVGEVWIRVSATRPLCDWCARGEVRADQPDPTGGEAP